jgi:membrane fusion protein, copper/silver efflux system
MPVRFGRNIIQIERQREAFSDVSDQMIESIEAFGLNREPVYVIYCPMALNNKGARWISDHEEVNNPFFGDKMLRCGEIKKTIRKRGNRNSKTVQQREHQH